MKILKEDRDLIISMIFGDGYLNPQGYLSIRHALKNKDYVEWKYQLLKSKFNVTLPYYVSNNGYGAYELRTKTYRFIKLYRKVIYGTGRKKISNFKLLNKLTPLGLAIWYMDDGHLSQKKRDGKVHANTLYINTYISKEENQIIINYFKEKWNICFTQNHDKGFYRLRCGTKEARKFLDIVRPYVSQIPSMSHKLLIKESIHYKILKH